MWHIKKNVLIVCTFLLQMFIGSPTIGDDMGSWSHMSFNDGLKNLTRPFTPRAFHKEDFICFSVETKAIQSTYLFQQRNI